MVKRSIVSLIFLVANSATPIAAVDKNVRSPARSQHIYAFASPWINFVCARDDSDLISSMEIFSSGHKVPTTERIVSISK